MLAVQANNAPAAATVAVVGNAGNSKAVGQEATAGTSLSSFDEGVRRYATMLHVANVLLWYCYQMDYHNLPGPL